MFEGSFKGVSRVFQGTSKGVSRKIEECSERPLSQIQGSLKVSKRSSKAKAFKVCLMNVLSVIQGKVKKSFKCVSKKFVLQCCCCLTLIAANRAEGGLV